jgi:uncharacterized phage protein (predicted DNA packaging)
MLTIEEFKEYARIDADDRFLNTMLLSASSYFKNKGITDEYLIDLDDKEQLKLGMLMLMTHYYENRGVITDKNLKNIPLGIQTIVFDLKMKCLVRKRELEAL